MAIECECFCGARYRVPDEQAGARVECPKCGHLIRIPAGQLDDLEPFDLADEPTAASVDAGITSGRQEQQARLANMRKAPKGMASAPKVIIETGSGFWGDVWAAFNLFARLQGFFAFLFVCSINVGQIFFSVIPLGWLIGILTYGYLCAYYMNSVALAAAGEEGLPEIGVMGSLVDDLIVPMLQWLGCQFFVLAPATVVGIILSNNAVSERVIILVCGLLGALGMFFWPIFILTVSLGGFSMLFRFDKCVKSVVGSPGPYLLICLLLLLAVGPVTAGRIYIYFDGVAPLTELTGLGPFSMMVVFRVLESYGILVCTRLIGLYYHHFKEDFPWAMG